MWRVRPAVKLRLHGVVDDVKRCARCGESKSLEEFPARARAHSRDGRGSYCRPCKRTLDREATKRWRERNPNKVKAANAASRERLGKEYFREWARLNADKERERSRLSMRATRKRNPDAERLRRATYRQRNLEAVRARERERTYARRASQPYSRELAVVMAGLVRQPCAYCGATTNITIDHIVPLARGGRHEANNLAPACYPCNSSKCDRTLSEWEGRYK